MKTILRYGILVILILSCQEIIGQGSYFVRVYFKDKGQGTVYNASDILSSRTIARREKHNITFPDYRDYPVNKQYIHSISSMGFRLHCTSKWMNTALFEVYGLSSLDAITGLSYVEKVIIVKTPGRKSRFPDKLHFETSRKEQLYYDQPVNMLNGYTLHNAGFRGNNILIAVLDGGFSSADRIESLSHLRARRGIISTWDFVNNTAYVYDSDTHGTAVMSVLAGDLIGHISGTAPSADFILLKTEDGASEFPCEEDFWVAGAEYADSTGADIISSSLGYNLFDDHSMNYKHSDLDGNTAFITRAADIAASKGILVVNSAGNERDNSWQRIIFPSDGDSVVAVGAVDERRMISVFSSAGPSSDRRIKPDVSAMGVMVPLQVSPGFVTRGNGTSFSCPVISGMAACLMQAVPEASNYDIIEALRQASDRYRKPDSLYGYGIPDISASVIKLRDKYPEVIEDNIRIRPNPSPGPFTIVFKDPPGPFTLEIFTTDGRVIHKKSYPAFSGRTITLHDLESHQDGLYIVRISKAGESFTCKVIKITR